MENHENHLKTTKSDTQARLQIRLFREVISHAELQGDWVYGGGDVGGVELLGDKEADWD